jgi:hypothetical protein
MDERDLFGNATGHSSNLMIPTAAPATEEKVMNLAMIEALRGIQNTQQASTAALASVQRGIHQIEIQLVRFEGFAAKLDKFETQLDEVEKDISALKEEKQRRAGMQWLVEWTAKFIPWLAAAAAAVWAIRVS